MNRGQVLRRTFTFPVLKRSIWVAVLVGTLLNLINQGDVLTGAHDLVVWKLLLTYCVPFFVASYGSYSALSSLERH
ncbi:MAG: nitrate/nitrite transporter NrtS [Novosphingobium sp.]|nr:nitrate/nitrite transporter NrtS [Novosphingobium sp.]